MTITDAHLIEVWARRLHEAYCFEDDNACRNDPARARSAANLPWEQLPESYRDSNRDSARHFKSKLQALGRRLIRSDSCGCVEAPLSPEELERMAMMEHERWMTHRAARGWTMGPVRDDAQRLHPDMVPFAELPEAARQLDRDKVNQMVSLIARDGWVIAWSTP